MVHADRLGITAYIANVLEIPVQHDSFGVLTNDLLKNHQFENTIEIIAPSINGIIQYRMHLKFNGKSYNKENPLLIFRAIERFNINKMECKYYPLHIDELNITANSIRDYKVIYNSAYKNDSTCIFLSSYPRKEIALKIEFVATNMFLTITGKSPVKNQLLTINIDMDDSIKHGNIVKIISRPTLATKFTKGNYCLALPSRYNKEDRITYLYFKNSRKINTIIGVYDTENIIFFSMIRSFFTMGFGLLILYYALTTDSSYRLWALIFAAVAPVFEYSQTFVLTPDLKKHLRKSFVLDAMFFYSLCCIAIAFIIFIANALNIAQSWLTPTWLLLPGISSVIVSVILFLLNINNIFDGYVCDNSGCSTKIYPRWLGEPFAFFYECNHTGRILCNKCMEKHCVKCTNRNEKYSTIVFGRIFCNIGMQNTVRNVLKRRLIRKILLIIKRARNKTLKWLISDSGSRKAIIIKNIDQYFRRVKKKAVICLHSGETRKKMVLDENISATCGILLEEDKFSNIT